MKNVSVLGMGSIILALSVFFFSGCGANVKMNQQGQVGMCIPFDFPQRADISAAPVEKEEPEAPQPANR